MHLLLSQSILTVPMGGSAPGPGAGDGWLMEDGTSFWLMEDGSSFWLMG